MPFSRASACIASRISRDMGLPYSSIRFERRIAEYGIAITPPSAASVTSSSEAPTSSPVKLRTVRASPWPRSTGRGWRTLTRARRPTKRRKCAGLVSGRSDPGEETSSEKRSRMSFSSIVTRSHIARSTPSGWSMKTRRQRPPSTSASSTSMSGSLWASRCSISVCSAFIFFVDPVPYAKRAGVRPLSVLLPALARRHESCASRIAPGSAPFTNGPGEIGRRSMPASPARRCRGGASAEFSFAPRAVPVEAVVLALRTQRARERKRLAGLAVAAELLHRSSQAEQRVVVRRRVRCDRPELLGGPFVALCVEQRAAERLADRGLVGLEVARFAQRDDRGLVVTVLEQLTAAPVELVHAVHRSTLEALAQPLHRVEDRARDLLLRRPRDLLGRDRAVALGGGEDRDLVRRRVEADVGTGDVVEDDRVESLRGELAAGALEALRAVLGREAHERLARAPRGRERAQHVGRRLQYQLELLAPALLDL